MKRQMDKDTILFVTKPKGGLAFNIAYYRDNFDKFTNVIEDPERILYKYTDKSDSWIDYQKAIQLKTGSLDERLRKAYEDENFRITDIREVPEAKYYDIDGYVHNIPPYDGYYGKPHWLERHQYNYDIVKYFFREEDLIVEFGPEDDVRDAIISLNSLFYHHEVITYNSIRFKNVKSLLSRIPLVGKREGIELRIEAYAWKGLKKQKPKFPIERKNEWYTMERPLEYNCFIVYNGVMYDYEIDENDRKRFKLKNVDVTNSVLFEIDDIYVYEMKSEFPNTEVRKYIAQGIGNKYRNSVEFALPVKNTMILFNGLDHQYEVARVNGIEYPDSIFSVNHVSNLSFITQVNFIKG